MLKISLGILMVVAVGLGFFYGMHMPKVSQSTSNEPGGVPAVPSTTPALSAEAASNATSTVTSATTPTVTSPVRKAPSAASSSPIADAFAGLGSDKYADGILPLGDGKYVTEGPKKGYVYLCHINTAGGGGAQVNGSWIGTSTWNISQKIAVQGAVYWPNATSSFMVQGSTRVITTNDLPESDPTGSFPVQANDPAAAIDRNPNSITAQNITLKLPAHPVATAAPSCIGGEVGVMTNGVALFDGFDELYRDAAAHEVQDLCSGHPQGAGEYHYHSLSSCFKKPSVSTVIGFAFDGFPITGPTISAGRYLTTDDLDECHGITSTIMLDSKNITTYHYVMTEDFPYSVGCFRGTSAVNGPTAPTQRGGTNGAGTGSTSQSGQNGGGPGGTPPQAAISACASVSALGACSFVAPQGGTISGICQMPPGQSSLACVPH